MPLLAGETENGWVKRVLKGGLVHYTSSLTHVLGDTSNQVTGLLPTEIINHIFKQFTNLHLYVNWGSGTKTTTFNLICLEPTSLNDVIQTRAVLTSAVRNGTELGAMIVPKNLYSSDGAFIDTTNVLSPYMIFQDLASSGSGTNTVDISLIYAPDDSSYSAGTIGDNL
jgi:hypothetical protein